MAPRPTLALFWLLSAFLNTTPLIYTTMVSRCHRQHHISFDGKPIYILYKHIDQHKLRPFPDTQYMASTLSSRFVCSVFFEHIGEAWLMRCTASSLVTTLPGECVLSENVPCKPYPTGELRAIFASQRTSLYFVTKPAYIVENSKYVTNILGDVIFTLKSIIADFLVTG